jgi:hypothetical protein
MSDGLKPVKSYDWTDEEWLRLMKEMDPAEEISAIECRVAEWRESADDKRSVSWPHARLALRAQEGRQLLTLRVGGEGREHSRRRAGEQNDVADNFVHDRYVYYCLTEVEAPLA